MKKDLYWQYMINVWDHIDEKAEMRFGVITAPDIETAKAEIKNIFGDALMLIKTIQLIETEE